ncbi:uncharacterized protein LOC143711149 isoform X2 [Siphateles boraxobius]|uniref:uncharacterized protein LOC143711149 isoform X2 n=1 Tax=Siphateles boraxobius TaxID=180520 RepID=UPI004062CF63
MTAKIAPGTWVLLKNKDIPQQIGGVDCGVFMLMYALHLVLGAPFDFTSCDFPNIRRWWALILLENFGIFSESAETLQESLPCEEQATLSSSEDSMKKTGKQMECMAGDLRVCCFQKVGKGPLYPSVVKPLWVQCDMCLGWLHTDCAGVKEAEVKKGTFKCGCDLTQPHTFDDTRKALRLGIENLISDQDIKALHEAFHNGDIKSCRFYLWKHPETSLKFKQHLKPKQCYFSESDLIKLADKIKRAVDADEDLENLNYIFDVMIPEVTILLVQRLEKICRYAVEVVMASGIVKFH